MRRRSPIGAFIERHPFLSLWLAAAVVSAAAFLAFLPALHNGFVNWDDVPQLIENSRYKGLGWNELKWMLFSIEGDHYHPLTWFSFGIDHAVWGMDPFGFHLTNLLLHASNTALFFLLSFLLLRRAASWSRRELIAAAGFSALFFGLHPLRVESVAWAYERKDVLSGFFFLWTLLLYVRHAGLRSPPRRRRWYWASAACYLLSMLSKASGATLPLVLVILNIYPLARLPLDPRTWLHRRHRALWLELAPFFLLGLSLGAVSCVAYSLNEIVSTHPRTPAQIVMQSLYDMGFYLWKTIAPFRLLPIYELPRPFDPWSWPFVLSGVGVVSAAAAAAVLQRNRRPFLLAALAFYTVTLLPSIRVLLMFTYLAADRYTYIPCLAWALLAGAGVAALARRVPRRAAAAYATVAFLLLAGLGALTWRQTLVWRDTESLWSHVLRIRPDTAMAHVSIGHHLLKTGRLEEAMARYREALRLDPKNIPAHFSLAGALERRGDLRSAEKVYRRVLEIAPGHAQALYQLALLLERRGEPGRAREDIAQAFSKIKGFRGSFFPDAPAEPGCDGLDSPSIRRSRKALESSPGDAKALYSLGAAYETSGAMACAAGLYRRALQADPGYGFAHNNLGSILARTGRVRQAARHFREAIRIDGRDTVAHYNLGNTLLLVGEYDEARTQFRTVLKLDPGHVRARRNLEALRAYLKDRTR